jgi:hypothetical protein
VDSTSLLILDKTISRLFWIPLIACPFLVINWIRFVLRSSKKKITFGIRVRTYAGGFPYKSILAFVVPIMVVSILSSIMTSIIRNDACEFLSSAGKNVTVTVEGMAVTDARPVIAALRQMSSRLAHHSHPEKVIHVTVTEGGQTLRLNLGRDSERPTEYWVFYPYYRHTSMNEIGRITTNVFDFWK